ncbi:hypothetical protein PtA15_11A366 [Puccinia triticina]|uniref:Uncharacterized protein n=1 Tax=Puccinia triticina TaxID=208348 RepID=A0ABY7D0Y0_9BASI|nr:uncharacterized protein PtA15_11A366 [Puccinia triticina]WAQ89675.1 hypothetical protein PtA15_11A366 [Puccinia triticina]WAR59710.1 hypothetical protein PtB15_11B350 [Puccinia triticina]
MEELIELLMALPTWERKLCPQVTAGNLGRVVDARSPRPIWTRWHVSLCIKAVVGSSIHDPSVPTSPSA